MTNRRSKLAIHVLAISLALFVHNVRAQEEANTQKIVERAAKSVVAFAAAEKMEGFRDNLENASAVLIIPRSVKAGFIVGMSGGDVTADVLVFSRSAGAFGGVSLKGGSVEPRTALNGSYYGRELSARDILIDGKAGADKAAELRSALNAAVGG